MLHQVGVGALGPVFRTYEPTRDRLVAVKVFRLDITPEQARTLADELSQAADAGLFHPSIVEPLAAGVEGTVAYRAEEYVAAESLDVAMRHYAPAALEKVLPFITQLAGAIDFARAAGVGHGALHPRDIFVTPDEARATGFGVVDALERGGLRAPIRRPYSAPERIAGAAWGAPADVFSLAAIAFELLTGRRPSGTGDQIGSLAGLPAEQAERLHGVLARAMHEDPSVRFPTALAFAGALEEGGSQAASSSAVASATAAAAPSLRQVAPSGPVPHEPEEMAAPSRQAAPPVAPVHETVPVTPVREPAPPSPVREAAPAAPAAPPAPPYLVPPLARDEGPEPDDIVAEREEDEAHWELFKDEHSQPEEIEAEEPRMLFSDQESEKAADQLMADAADLALRSEESRGLGLRDERFTDQEPLRSTRFASMEPQPFAPSHEHGRPAPSVVVPPASPPPRAVVPPPVPRASHLPLGDDDLPLADDLRREPILRDESDGARRPSMLPLTLTLLVGLLLGFVAAYAILSRTAPPQTVSEESTAAAPAESTGSPTGSTGAPAGRAYSEGTVSPPPSPPAAPPEVPADSGASTSSRTSAPSPAASDKTPSASRPQPRTGRLVVRSTPAGAAVTINGTWRGRTPLTLDELAFGDYVVRIVQPGYEVAREELKLSASQATRTLSHRLVRTPGVAPGSARGGPARGGAARTSATGSVANATRFVGSIYVDSRPRGAKVFIDGKELGTTPLRVPEMGIGAHVVRLELADHRTWTNGIRVAAGEEVRVTGSLEPIR